MSLARREQLILAFRDKLLEHKDELVELDILETGKVGKCLSARESQHRPPASMASWRVEFCANAGRA